MTLPRAIKARGRYSLILALAGEEDSPACFLPDVLPFTDINGMAALGIDGSEVYFDPDQGGSVIIGLKQLAGAKPLSDYISLCMAQGRFSRLNNKFDAIIVLNEMRYTANGGTEYAAVRYKSCSISPLKDGRLKLRLKPFGTLGTLYGGDYADINECFEEGWEYD